MRGDHCVILGGCLFFLGLSLFLGFMQQWLPGFAEVESPISVDVIWMHLNFETSAFRTQDAGELPKRKHITLLSKLFMLSDITDKV